MTDTDTPEIQLVSDKELVELRNSPRGTEEVDFSEATWLVGEAGYDVGIKWNGYNCDVLAIDGNTLEVFIP